MREVLHIVYCHFLLQDQGGKSRRNSLYHRTTWIKCTNSKKYFEFYIYTLDGSLVHPTGALRFEGGSSRNDQPNATGLLQRQGSGYATLRSRHWKAWATDRDGLLVDEPW